MDGPGGPISGGGSTNQAAVVGLERAAGTGRVRIGSGGGVAEFYQQGALRLRRLRVAAGEPTAVVAINTAGGLTGGDRLDLAVLLDRAARGMITTPACEKIYRSAGGDATVVTNVQLATGSSLEWLPQPMLVFDGGRVRRRFEVDIAPDARLLAVEGVILGRTAMAEEMRSGAIRDGWRIRRGGTLVYADSFQAFGDVRGGLATRATLGGARGFATVVVIAPDAERRTDAARDALGGCTSETGASAWNGMLIVRFLSPDGQSLVTDLGTFLSAFRAAPLPRSWLC